MQKYLFASLMGLFFLPLGLMAQAAPVFQKNGLTLTGVVESSEFSKATLKLQEISPAPNKGQYASSLTFKFLWTNYTLKMQTANAAELMCANSKDGQHIHFILDNSPYQALYDSGYLKKDIKDGHHVLLAFLSRSYHMSLKQKSAYILKEFNTGEAAAADNFNEKAPHLFYSRPKGDYIGAGNIKKVLLDFYLINCNLSDKGFKVKVTIDGTEFLISKWMPYFIEGLSVGEHNIKLELIDKSNKTVASPFNPVERKFTLATGEPLPPGK